GVHIESVNSHGQTPLFCASFGGDNEVVALLLRLGANPNRRCGVKGATPVHGASYRGSRRVLRLLVEAGGDLSLLDNEDQTPRDYALKQPSPIRRQKIINFLDLLLAMTLHRSLARTATTTNVTLPHPTLNRSISKTSLALKRQGSLASVWGACITEGDSTSPRSPPYKGGTSTNLHKTVSCHLLDQMYVSTSLPLLTPPDLKRPEVTGIAYTCGGPTVYSPYTWLGTNVTVRRPTPALSLPKENALKGEDKSSLDQGACNSLVQELSVLRRLRHPAFLEVMAACHVTSPYPDHITLVFQHVPHGSLYHHLHVQHRDLSVGGAVDILVGVVEALLFLHAHNWLHTALSSHALHLVSMNHAKLGGFEFALEMHGKGCSMKAPELLRATWLHPWQAPETLSEQMVSTRSEIYSFTAIMWEIWSGMPPWSGVEEAEVLHRVGAGETLPAVSGVSPSLVTYLTQYGLKWNSHERELDLQEIHTMLRSLRIQSNEEDRVPAVPAWGPPSIPNTPVIGRHTSQTSANTSPLSKRKPSVSNQNSSSESYNNRKYSSGSLSSHPEISSDYNNKLMRTKGSRKDSSSATQMVVSSEVHHSKSSTASGRPARSPPERHAEGLQKSPNVTLEDKTDGGMPRVVPGVPGNAKGMVTSVDSGFSTPCTRTPSPTLDTITSAKINPSFITSTPARPPTTSVLRVDLQPDLLPNKVNIKSLKNGQTPDILSRGHLECGKGGCRNQEGQVFHRNSTSTSVPPLLSPIMPVTDSDHSRTSSPTDEEQASGYGYISNAAKRAFLIESDGGDEGSPTMPERPSSASRLDRNDVQSQVTDVLRRNEVVRRGLSMTNINSPSLATSTSVTRTTSHVSLTSASSSASSDISGRRPVRTVSQITLTLRKLSQVSDSSSSKDDMNEPQQEQQARTRRSRSAPKSPAHSARSSKKEVNSGWEEITGIKPASHQLTRHSSSCSLASGPSSPTHYSGSSSTSWQHSNTIGPCVRPSSNQGSPSRSPTSGGTKAGVGRRWNSISGTSAGLGDSAVKIQTRRHSEGQRTRPRKSKRRQEVE
ncbi:Inactive serine/threonine-protein kinase TEX14-like, partial [Homarus americanus]